MIPKHEMFEHIRVYKQSYFFSVMLGAGLLAKNAVEKGLKVSPYIKTSLSPGKPISFKIQNKNFELLIELFHNCKSN